MSAFVGWIKNVVVHPNVSRVDDEQGDQMGRYVKKSPEM
jgi:hypothetical protein